MGFFIIILYFSGKCILSYLQHGYSPDYTQEYFQGDSVRVHCHPGYSLPNQQTSLRCTDSGWSPPPTCVSVSKFTGLRAQDACRFLRLTWNDCAGMFISASCFPNESIWFPFFQVCRRGDPKKPGTIFWRAGPGSTGFPTG